MHIDFDFLSPVSVFAVISIVPFPLFQVQSRFMARVWTGQMELPDENERLASVKKQKEGLLIEEGGSGNLTVIRLVL